MVGASGQIDQELLELVGDLDPSELEDRELRIGTSFINRTTSNPSDNEKVWTCWKLKYNEMYKRMF